MNNHRSPWFLKGMRYIERHYGRSKTRDIAERLGRTATAIRLQAQNWVATNLKDRVGVKMRW